MISIYCWYSLRAARMNINEGRLSTAIISVGLRLGYTELKPCQESAVKSFVSGKDVFVLLPTGYGS